MKADFKPAQLQFIFNHKAEKSGRRGFNWTLNFWIFAQWKKWQTAEPSLETITYIKPLFISVQQCAVKQALHTLSRLCSTRYKTQNEKNIQEA